MLSVYQRATYSITAGRKAVNQSFRLSGQHLEQLQAMWCSFVTATDGTQRLHVRRGSLQQVLCPAASLLCSIVSSLIFHAVCLQISDPGNAFFKIPAVSFSLLDVELVNAPAAPPAAWFIQAIAIGADGSDVEVLLQYSANEVPVRQTPP